MSEQTNIAIDVRNQKNLENLFPGGFRITRGRTSGYGCSAFVLNHFFPKRFSLYDTDPDINNTFKDEGNNQFKVVDEYEVSKAENVRHSEHFKKDAVIAYVDLTPIELFGRTVENKTVNHVGVIVEDPEQGLCLESKLNPQNSPQIITFDLGDMLRYEQEAGTVTHIQILEAIKSK
ncbi:MAG: hypothetical protein WA152_01810 [Microgenomates group bacterium]